MKFDTVNFFLLKIFFKKKKLSSILYFPLILVGISEVDLITGCHSSI